MKTVTEKELLAILLGMPTSAIVGCELITETTPRLRGGKSAPKGITKVSSVRVTLNAKYENKVNRQLVKEGQSPDFESQGDPAWKTRLSRIVSTHAEKGEFYLDYMPESVGQTIYKQDGKVIDKKEIENYLVESKPGFQGGNEVPVIFRHCKLGSIVSLQVRGETYVVTPKQG